MGDREWTVCESSFLPAWSLAIGGAYGGSAHPDYTPPGHAPPAAPVVLLVA